MGVRDTLLRIVKFLVKYSTFSRSFLVSYVRTNSRMAVRFPRSLLARTVTQATSLRPVTAEASFHPRQVLCEVCGERSGMVTRLNESKRLRFPL